MNTNRIELWLLEHKDRDFKYFDLLYQAQQLRFEKLKGTRQIEFGFTRLLLNHIVKQKLNLETGVLSPERLDSPERVDSLELINSLERVESPKRIESLERVNLPPSIPSFETNGWLFSISHSAGMIAIAVMRPSDNIADKTESINNLLGLDIECLHKPRKLSAAPVFCNEQQLKSLSSLTDEQSKKEYFTRLWTQKEAYFKARHLPILNENLKAASFRQANTNADQQPDLQSARYNPNSQQDYQFSVYHNAPAKIAVRMASVLDNGEIVNQQSEDVGWEPYLSHVKAI